MNEGILNGETVDIVAENVGKLRQLFPEIVCEDKIDFDRLQDVLGNYIERNDETYRFTWYGKSEAFKNSQIPSTGTLLPYSSNDESKDFDATGNLYIEGDNLEVLKLLRKSYTNKVKMIYIDPPYNKGKDFVYPDKWSNPILEYKRITGQVDDYDKIISSDVEGIGGKHTKWLNLMYPRLRLARNLLTDDGVIFISIDDDEQANLKKLCDEVFGVENFVTVIHVQMSTVQGQKVKAAKDGNIVKNGEYILVYSKNGAKNIGKQPLQDPVKYDNHYNKYLQEVNANEFLECNLVDKIYENSEIMKELELLSIVKMGAKLSSNNIQNAYDISPKLKKWVIDNSKNICRIHDSIDVPENVVTKMKKDIISTYNSENRSYLIGLNNNSCVFQRILLSEKINVADDFYKTLGPTTLRGDWWSGFYLDMGNVNKEGDVNYDNGKKPVRLIKQIVNFVTSDNDIILDFFSGSATTAHAVMQLNAEDGGNRKFIMVQLPENLDKLLSEAETTAKNDIRATIDFLDSIEKPHFISELGKYRIRCAGDKLKTELQNKFDKYEKKQSQMSLGTESDAITPPMNPNDLDIGFRVLKLDSSNLQKWNLKVDDDFHTLDKKQQHLILSEKLGIFINNFEDGRDELDMVFEIMIKYGLPLSMPVDTYTFDKKNVYSIGLGQLIIILDDELKEELAESVVELIRELEPRQVRVVVKDLGFTTDSAKTNFKGTLKQGVESYLKENKETGDLFEFITV